MGFVLTGTKGCLDETNIYNIDDVAFIFLFPLGQPKLKEALNNALEKGQGDLMVNASVYVTGWWFLIGEVGIKIKGDVVNTRGGKQ